jgi:type II secretory pathway component PulF
MAITLSTKATLPGPKQPEASSVKRLSFPEQWQDMVSRFRNHVNLLEITAFMSQLSLTLEIGMSLKKALEAIGAQTKNPALKDVIQSMTRDIEEGRQLSEAMKRHPRLFNPVYVSMIKAGETGGFLKGIVDRIVEMQEKRQALITEVRAALTYPVVLCVLSIVVVVFILVGVLPKFTQFFEGKEHVLPLTTRFLIVLSASLQGYWWAYVVGAAGLIVGIRWWKDSPPGRAMTDRFCVKGPVLSGLCNKIYTCQMLRTLGHLMESQVPLLEALSVTRSTIKNRYFVRFVSDITSHVEQGGAFAQPFSSYPHITETVKSMIATGEEAGRLPPVMLRLAEFFDSEVNQEMKKLSSMIEPLALIVMGGVVGLIVSSVVLPMFKLARGLH